MNLKYFMILLLLAGCKKADQQYETLYRQPEVLAYNDIYGVGDTLVMQGRLNPEFGLTIKIGDQANVDILEKEKIEYAINGNQRNKTTIDRIKIIITAQMGIGPNRPVAITSSGNTIAGKSIEIYEGGNMGYLASPLKFTYLHTLVGGSKILHCRSGSGRIYLWSQLLPARSVIRLNTDGTLTTILSPANYVDSYGNFTITTFNGGGVDPQERYLYFSAITTDNSPGNAANEIYRFCKVDLGTGQLTTLNRSLYPKTASQRTLTNLTPFEGNFAQVKLFNATGIYPDSTGNVYVNLGYYFVGRLDVAGQFNYLFRFQARPSTITANLIPQVWNTADNQYYSAGEVLDKMPGKKVNGYFRAIAPDEQLLYGIASPSIHNLIQYDLANQVPLYTFEPALAEEVPYISGSFSLLTGYRSSTPSPSLFGYMAMPGQKLLLLYYQGTNASTGPYSQFPAFGVLNFAQKRGERYAPGKVDMGIYQLSAKDELLNTDAEGMLYLTANDGQYILKTTEQ